MSSNYSSVPPPAGLDASDPAASYTSALEKAKAIAARLSKGASPASTQDQPGSSLKRSHEEGSYGDYDKRAAYDQGGRPSYSNPPSRYGLGSEERRSQPSHYGSTRGDDLASGEVQDEMNVVDKFVGLIIGRGGENLKRIERDSGAKVQIHQPDHDLIGERRITIKGRPSDVKAARQYIQDTIDGTDSVSRPPMGSGPPPPGGSSAVITIPAFRVGLVIGRGGETIRDLQDRSGARIAISPDNMPGSTEREVTITGSDAAVQQAKTMIEEVVASDNRGPPGGGGGYGPPGYDAGSRPYGGGYGSRGDSETIMVNGDSVGLIIGRGGETIKWLQDESGARIKVDPQRLGGAEREVLLIGPPQTIAKAKQMIQDKVASGRDRGHGRSRGYGLGSSGDYGQDQYNYGGGYDYSQYGGQYDQQAYDQYYAAYGQYGQYGQYAQQYTYPTAAGYEGAQGAGASGATEGTGQQNDQASAGASSQPPAPPSGDQTTSASSAADATHTQANGDSTASDPNAAYYAQYYGQNYDPNQYAAYYYGQYYQGQEQPQEGQSTEPAQESEATKSPEDAPTSEKTKEE
ncbi:hypothetical protein BZG36_02929 [Bifiguratus adelaidae]|uniref:K Homology domain-containing protein n=1 Tax=Bifiguratus adelaidae TaxID=1938954 RepID=A0A261Y019_9FUNG|nr:hypothetical protein BZG36_02929 [Bifiguratus adelaidae]